MFLGEIYLKPPMIKTCNLYGFQLFAIAGDNTCDERALTQLATFSFSTPKIRPFLGVLRDGNP